MRNINIEGNALIFKSITILSLLLTTSVSQAIINQLSVIQKNIMPNRKNPKLKHSTLSNNYGGRGLTLTYLQKLLA